MAITKTSCSSARRFLSWSFFINIKLCSFNKIHYVCIYMRLCCNASYNATLSFDSDELLLVARHCLCANESYIADTLYGLITTCANHCLQNYCVSHSHIYIHTLTHTFSVHSPLH